MVPSRWLVVVPLLLLPQAVCGQDQAALAGLLGRPILEPRQAAQEWHDYLDARIPRLAPFTTVAEWEAYAGKLRQTVLDQVVFKGSAGRWRTAKTRVEWLDTIPGGPGYRIKKLRYEVLPGLWVPALLYEPETLTGKVAVGLAVNGHDRNGKAADYKQIRCINMARRGMLVLNLEWFGMGQLSTPGFGHGAMNQLDLCGAAGLAPFYLAMSRGLDVLLAHPSADPQRVSVSGLSGGGWQTIVISSLDLRVTLTNPVAGYSSFRTRLAHAKDLGDSEQTPCDLAVHADYTHLTALMAPRPTLLTYNAKDNCCFEAGYALPPLLEAAGPFFTLHGKKSALRSHINHDPGTHNFEKDNRQAFYRMLGDFFFAEDKTFKADEIPCAGEVKSREDLAVELPDKNLDFQKLALALASGLPSNDMPADRMKAPQWQKEQRERLKQIVKAHDLPARAKQVDTTTAGECKVAFWQLRLGDAWTVPVVELSKGQPRETVILLNDSGRKTDAATVERWLKSGQRVLAVDLALQGEAITDNKGWLLALMQSSVGERLLGLQASQLTAVARWARGPEGSPAVTVAATGPRTSTAALVAAALEPEAIGKVEVLGSLGSLKQIIEDNRTVNQWPEMFCFGLLESFDLKQIVALAAPRPVVFRMPEARVKKEMAELKGWYELLGKTFDPVAEEKRP